MDSISIRIFGANNCEKCVAFKKACDFYSIGYKYIDVDNPDNQSLCDERSVDELPHIEAVFEKINRVFYVYRGYINPVQFLENSISQSDALQKDLQSLNINEIADADMLEIKKMMQTQNEKKGCSACSRKKNAQS